MIGFVLNELVDEILDDFNVKGGYDVIQYNFLVIFWSR